MAVFLSAGHTLSGPNHDPGAVRGDYIEANLTAELRDLIAEHLTEKGVRVITDRDAETLAQYIARIKPGSGSVVCDLHFNAVTDPQANGTECFVPDRSTGAEREAAAELCAAGQVISLRNRGVKTPSQSRRGRLAILDEQGLNLLLEVAFLSNADDMKKYQEGKECYAKMVAAILKRYDDMFT